MRTCYAIAVSIVALVATPNCSADGLALPELITQVEPAVVRIEVERRQGAASGSGFLVEGGWIVTNCHVIEGAVKADVCFADKTKAKVLGARVIAPENDLAVLEIEPQVKRPALELAGATPRKGEAVVAFGAPMGFGFTATEGIVSGVRDGKEIKEVLDDEYTCAIDMTWIQTTAAISSGNSGGPLVDTRGNVVGVNTWTYKSAQNLNFSAASPHVRKLLTEISKKPLVALSDVAPSKSNEITGVKSKAQLSYNHFARSRFEKQFEERRDRLKSRADMLQSNLLSVESNDESIESSRTLFRSALDDVRKLKEFDPGVPNFLKEEGAVFGKAGAWYVFQVIGEDSLLVSSHEGVDNIYCVRDVSTVGKVDHRRYDFDDVWYTLGETYSYETRGGSSRTVYVFRKFPLEVSAALAQFRTSEIEPAIESALKSIKEPSAPTGEQLAKLTNQRKAYQAEKAERERLLAIEREKQELVALENRARGKLQFAKQRLAVGPVLEKNVLARKYLFETMAQFPTTEAAREAEQLVNAGQHDHFHLFQSGKYSTNAFLMGKLGENVVLKKDDGKIVQVPIKRLSESDQQYVVEELRRRTTHP